MNLHRIPGWLDPLTQPTNFRDFSRKFSSYFKRSLGQHLRCTLREQESHTPKRSSHNMVCNGFDLTAA
jgi:hypothetical protein